MHTHSLAPAKYASIIILHIIKKTDTHINVEYTSIYVVELAYVIHFHYVYICTCHIQIKNSYLFKCMCR